MITEELDNIDEIYEGSNFQKSYQEQYEKLEHDGLL